MPISRLKIITQDYILLQFRERCVLFGLTGITLYELWGSRYVGS